jgi:hypothetical protein
MGKGCRHTSQDRRHGPTSFSILAFLLWNKDPVVWNTISCIKTNLIVWHREVYEPCVYTQVTSKVVNLPAVWAARRSNESGIPSFCPPVVVATLISTTILRGVLCRRRAQSVSNDICMDSEDMASNPSETHARTVSSRNVKIDPTQSAC